MPKFIKKEENPLVETPDKIKEILKEASEIAELDLLDPENLAKVKEVVCSFYRNGNHPECDTPRGCGGCKSLEKISACRDEYIEMIFDRPQEFWTPEFDLPLSRELVPTETVVGAGVLCNSCYVSYKCPLFKKNHQCAIPWETDAGNLSNEEIISKLVDIQMNRVSRETFFEKMDGGKADATLSGEIDRLASLVSHRQNLSIKRASINITATESGGGEKSEGILSKLFGGGNKAIEEKKSVIDIPFDEEKSVEVVKRKRIDKEA